MKDQGIEDAVAAVEEINNYAQHELCRLDIYGKIDNSYEEDFHNIMRKATKAVQYKGMVPYEKSAETIAGYYGMLFPTFWLNECFPGAIIDAFSAGLPVIASDWNSNGEIIKDGENGLLYPNENYASLKEAILWAINNKEKLTEMRTVCSKIAKKYQPDVYINKIIAEVEQNDPEQPHSH